MRGARRTGEWPKGLWAERDNGTAICCWVNAKFVTVLLQHVCCTTTKHVFILIPFGVREMQQVFEGVTCIYFSRAVQGNRVYLDAAHYLNAQRKSLLCVFWSLQQEASKPPCSLCASGDRKSQSISWWFLFRLWLLWVQNTPAAAGLSSLITMHAHCSCAPQNKEHFVRQLLQPSPAACHKPREAPLFLIVIYYCHLPWHSTPKICPGSGKTESTPQKWSSLWRTVVVI